MNTTLAFLANVTSESTHESPQLLDLTEWIRQSVATCEAELLLFWRPACDRSLRC